VQLLASYTKANDQDKAECEIELKKVKLFALAGDLSFLQCTQEWLLWVIFLEAFSGVTSQDIDGLLLISGVFFFFFFFFLSFNFIDILPFLFACSKFSSELLKSSLLPRVIFFFFNLFGN